MQIPVTLLPAIKIVMGFLFFAIGLSFGWKFLQAALLGKIAYWSGLEKFGFLFIPITWFLSPLLIHLPFNSEKSLIHEKQSLWIHLVFGPVFFVFALMFMTSGADLMGLPGSNSLNIILTFNRSDVPPCIIYTPPDDAAFPQGLFNYRFPFVKKATKVVLRFLTRKIPVNKKDSYNAFEQRGDVDASEYSKMGGEEWFSDDDDKSQAQQQAQQDSSANKGK